MWCLFFFVCVASFEGSVKLLAEAAESNRAKAVNCVLDTCRREWHWVPQLSSLGCNTGYSLDGYGLGATIIGADAALMQCLAKGFFVFVFFPLLFIVFCFVYCFSLVVYLLIVSFVVLFGCLFLCLSASY